MAAPWRTQNNFYRRHLYNVMQLYKSRPDLQMFTEIILSLVAIIVFGIFAIRPTLVTIASLIQEIEVKEDVVAQLDQKVQNLSLAQQAYQSNLQAITLLNTSIPDKPLVHEFIRQTEAVVTNSSVTLNIFTFEHINLLGEPLSASLATSDTEAVIPFSSNASEIHYSLSVSGNYRNTQRFLKEFENLLMVHMGDKNHVETTELDGTLTLTISGRIPYSKKQ